MNSPRGGPWAALWLLLAAGCSMGLLPELDRVRRDPAVSAPLVRSLDQELRIEVSWDLDPAAEGYVLERSEDSLAGAFSVVYRGTRTAYADSDCRNHCRYLYRLSKSRGSRLFGPSAAVLGVACYICKDDLEPNDSESQASALGDFQLRANLYYYRATPALYPGQQLQDEDWFWLQVPPQRVANLLVTQVGLPPGSEHSYICFYRKATTPIHVVNNQLVALANPFPEPQRIAFKLHLEPEDFILEPSLGGGAMVDYTIVLHSVVGQ